jgi:hypothetical protein
MLPPTKLSSKHAKLAWRLWRREDNIVARSNYSQASRAAL